MKITIGQAEVLGNLDRITVRMVGRKPVPTLDGEDCRLQLFSLCARGLAALDANGEWIKIADANGIVGASGRPTPDELPANV